MTFIVEIAGIPVRIVCRFSQNKLFFKEYLSEKSPWISICPTENDCMDMEKRQREQAVKEGIPDKVLSPWFIENNAIHALLTEKLLQYNTILVHGSAIVVDGAAYVFMADSGTGKSTHTRLWREHFQKRAWMLNDDKPMLKIEADRIVAYGTPWNGKHHLSRNACSPVKAIVEISRSETNYIQPISKADAFTLVHRYGLRPNSSELIIKTMQLETQIIQKVDAYHLHCNMDPEAVLVAYQGMTEGET